MVINQQAVKVACSLVAACAAASAAVLFLAFKTQQSTKLGSLAWPDRRMVARAASRRQAMGVAAVWLAGASAVLELISAAL